MSVIVGFRAREGIVRTHHNELTRTANEAVELFLLAPRATRPTTLLSAIPTLLVSYPQHVGCSQSIATCSFISALITHLLITWYVSGWVAISKIRNTNEKRAKICFVS